MKVHSFSFTVSSQFWHQMALCLVSLRPNDQKKDLGRHMSKSSQSNYPFNQTLLPPLHYLLPRGNGEGVMGRG
jgi:hypothetical protein